MFSVAAAVFFHKQLNAALGHLFRKLSYWQISVLFLPSSIEEPVLFSAYYFLVSLTNLVSQLLKVYFFKVYTSSC